jgi:hypothetical protein
MVFIEGFFFMFQTKKQQGGDFVNVKVDEKCIWFA